MRGKYRLRTSLRGRLPLCLNWLAPKGSGDCGEHEWYRQDENTFRCYHCEPGVTHGVPWDARELAARELEAQAMRVRAGS